MKISGDFVVVKATDSMIGQKIVLPISDITLEELMKMPAGEVVHVTIKTIPDKKRRVNRQHNLYWAGCAYVADNYPGEDPRNWATREIVDEQVKIHLRFIDVYYYYMNEATGETTLNLRTKSISFENLEHLDAQGFFDKAFDFMSQVLDMEVPVFLAAVKELMGE